MHEVRMPLVLGDAMSDPPIPLDHLLARLVVELGPERMRFVLERELYQKPTPEQIEAARDAHGGDEVNIDDDAYLSDTDEGYWVSAWVWLDYPTCGRCRERHGAGFNCDPLPEQV